MSLFKPKDKSTVSIFPENSSLRKKLVFSQGSNFFRQRLVLSLLSSRPIRITSIRTNSSDLDVGVRKHEMCFIKLLSELSNGSKFKINETGTEVTCTPGLLSGGTLTFDTHTSRSLSYYLEPILLLAPFCKKPIELTLKGRLQNDEFGYTSVYKIKHVALQLMETFGLEPQIEVISRKYSSSTIKFSCNVKKQLLTLRSQLSSDCGKTKKIRGLAYGFRISPQLLNRIVSAAKGVFIPFLSDVFITTDVVKGQNSKEPGYGLVLYSTTTSNIHYASDAFIDSSNSVLGSSGDNSKSDPGSQNSSNDKGLKRLKSFKLFDEDEDEEEEARIEKRRRREAVESVLINIVPSLKMEVESPEELGVQVAQKLMKEMSSKACVDSLYQWLVLGFMALGPKDVSSVHLGPLTPFTIQFLRDLKEFFGITFKVEEIKEEVGDDDEEEEETSKLFKLSCLGTGFININKTLI